MPVDREPIENVIALVRSWNEHRLGAIPLRSEFARILDSLAAYRAFAEAAFEPLRFVELLKHYHARSEEARKALDLLAKARAL